MTTTRTITASGKTDRTHRKAFGLQGFKAVLTRPSQSSAARWKSEFLKRFGEIAENGMWRK